MAGGYRCQFLGGTLMSLIVSRTLSQGTHLHDLCRHGRHLPPVDINSINEAQTCTLSLVEAIKRRNKPYVARPTRKSPIKFLVQPSVLPINHYAATLIENILYSTVMYWTMLCSKALAIRRVAYSVLYCAWTFHPPSLAGLLLHCVVVRITGLVEAMMPQLKTRIGR